MLKKNATENEKLSRKKPKMQIYLHMYGKKFHPLVLSWFMLWFLWFLPPCCQLALNGGTNTHNVFPQLFVSQLLFRV